MDKDTNQRKVVIIGEGSKPTKEQLEYIAVNIPQTIIITASKEPMESTLPPVEKLVLTEVKYEEYFKEPKIHPKHRKRNKYHN